MRSSAPWIARRRLVRSLTRTGIVLSVIAALASSGIVPVSAHRAGASMPTLYWNALEGTSTWVPSLDPAMVTGSPAATISELVYGNLDKLAISGGGVLPDLTTWTLSKNHRVYVFTVRKGARFSNGDPITAEDLRYSITRPLWPSVSAPFGYGQFSHIIGAKRVVDGKTKVLQGLKVLNSRQLQVTLDQPISYFLALITWPTSDVLDERIVKGKTSADITRTCALNVASGPFMFVCRNNRHDLSSFYPSGTTPTMTLVPNPYYYNRPHIRMVLRAYGSLEVNYSAFQANEVDATALPSVEIARNRGKPGFAGTVEPGTVYLAPNMDAAPFNNVHCRLAVAYAINQDTLDNQVLHRTQVPLYTIVPKGVLGWYPGNNNPHFNPGKAKQELAQCPGGIHNVKIPYYNGGTDTQNMMSVLQSMLSSVGIGVTPLPETLGDFTRLSNETLQKAHYDMILYTWGASPPDPQQFFDWLLWPGVTNNVSDYRNSTVTRLTEQADLTFNRQKRGALYVKASHIVANEGGMIMVGQQTAFGMVKPWVHGMVFSYDYYGFMPAGVNWSNVSVSRH